MADPKGLREEVERLGRENREVRAELDRLRVIEEEAKQIHASLRESEGRYRSVVQGLDDGVVLHDHDGRIIASNNSAARVLGLTTDQLHGRTSLDPNWECIHPDGSPFPGSEHPGRKSLETGETFHGVVMGVRKPDGELSWISVNSRPVERPGGAGRYSVVASFCDITKEVNTRKALESNQTRLQTMLAEKETLLRELYHRSRNNMSVVRGLLSLRARSSRVPGLQEVLNEVDDRIQAMELVHRSLYRSPDLSQVDLASYLPALLAALRKSHGIPETKLGFEINLTPVRLTVELAIPFGLVATEVVSNAMKHAFPGEHTGTLTVELREPTADTVELVVADDGVGLTEGSDVEGKFGLMVLAQIVRHQLHGKHSLESNGGVTFRLQFSKHTYDAGI